MLYHVFAYLLIFRYDDLPRDELCSFILSQDAVKMNVFLSFFFDTGRLRKSVYEEWCTVFDEEYVNDFVLEGIQRKYEDLSSLLNKISEKATGKALELSTMKKKSGEEKTLTAKVEKKFQPTQQKPFKLSEAKPRLLPEPIKIEKKVKANPVPVSTYLNTLVEVETGKKQKLDNQIANDKKRAETDAMPFVFETDNRPMYHETLQKINEVRIKKDLQFGNAYYKPAPDFEPVEVKMTEAAMKREINYINQDKNKKEQELKEIEWNMRDSSEFKNWKEEQKRVDKQNELAHMMKRKLEMELAHEAAIAAKNDKIKENEANAQEIKDKKEEDN